ncbi:MAG TPA: pyridoxamine 5'-phosphate oxidase family protein [Nocardioides sp.]|jgi:nitroimidazol reductase NimA-like FMN-containing flavoprotein (pyridoxamine 5'-phosphate oxidase superfamily)|nr:pyridoxamine 5'-phosphate oxidase family protein [Nocardioides sp.]
MASIVDLRPEECRRLLRRSVLGRLALVVPPGRTELFPVNYLASEREFWLRTGRGTLLDRHADDAEVVLEVDDIDPDRGTGWSLVARGRAVRAAEGPRTSTGRLAPSPPRWVSRDELVWFRVPWRELTGRRLGAPVAPAGGPRGVAR